MHWLQSGQMIRTNILPRTINFHFEKVPFHLLHCLPQQGHAPRADAVKPRSETSALPAKNCGLHGSPCWERWFLTGSGSSATRTRTAFSILPACIITFIRGGTLLKICDARQYNAPPLSQAALCQLANTPLGTAGTPSAPLSKISPLSTAPPKTLNSCRMRFCNVVGDTAP